MTAPALAFAEYMTKRDALIESACEEALQSGTKGVALVKGEGSAMRVCATEAVPYGQIYKFVSEESWSNYLARM